MSMSSRRQEINYPAIRHLTKNAHQLERLYKESRTVTDKDSAD